MDCGECESTATVYVVKVSVRGEVSVRTIEMLYGLQVIGAETI